MRPDLRGLDALVDSRNLIDVAVRALVTTNEAPPEVVEADAVAEATRAMLVALVPDLVAATWTVYATRDGLDESRRLLPAVCSAVAVLFRSLKPLGEANRANAMLAAGMLERLAVANGCPLDLDARQTLVAGFLAIDGDREYACAVREAVARSMSGRRPTAASVATSGSATAFIAVPMTPLGEQVLAPPTSDESDVLIGMAGVVADVLRTGAISQPFFNNRSSAGEENSATALVDLDQVVGADLTLVWLRRAACGIGVVVSRTLATSAVVIVVVPEGVEISPLVSGHPGDVDVLRYPPGGEPDLAELAVRVQRRVRDIDRHRVVRAGRAEIYGPRLVRVRAHVEANGPQGQRHGWPADLVDFALRSVDHLATANMEMIEDLEIAATSAVPRERGTGGGRPLRKPEVRAALSAAKVGGWDDDRLAGELAHVSYTLHVGKARLRLTNVSDWLHRRRRG